MVRGLKFDAEIIDEHPDNMVEFRLVVVSYLTIFTFCLIAFGGAFLSEHNLRLVAESFACAVGFGWRRFFRACVGQIGKTYALTVSDHMRIGRCVFEICLSWICFAMLAPAHFWYIVPNSLAHVPKRPLTSRNPRLRPP